MRARPTLKALCVFLTALLPAACSSDGEGASGDPGGGGADAGERADTAQQVDAAQADPGADPGSEAPDEATPPADTEDAGEDVDNPAGLVVRVDQGLLRGARAGHGVRVFKGIPYAAPPLGELRWKPPTEPLSWAGERDSTTFGAQCPQPTMIPPGGYQGNEDCLYLNVWVPDFPPVDPAPVMVWIHGGAFVIGSGAETTYNGANLARATGVVVVTLNYRLGALGFLAHPTLAEEDGDEGGAGVFGLLDQRAALRWVRDNISAFGGDPAKVTLFGESAGGISTCVHLFAPQSVGLFHRAIVQSGPCTTIPFPSRAEAFAQGERLEGLLGCAEAEDAVECMRAAPARDAQTLLSGGDVELFFGGDSWLPAVDGAFLPDQPWKLLAEGEVNAVPLIAGTNKDEGQLMTFLAKEETPTTEEEAREWLKILGGDPSGGSLDTILGHYPIGEDRDVKLFVEEVISDSTFICPTRELLRGFHAAGVPAWRYSFELKLEGGYFKDLDSFHAAEVPFVFGTTFVGSKVSDEDKPVSDAMMGYWAAHAGDGTPSDDADIVWPPYDAGTDPYLRFAHPIAPGAGLKSESCDLWDGIWASIR